MRIWHYKLLPYLPDLQFKGQLRELVAIMRAWRGTGTTNHLLINRVMEYEKAELSRYFLMYEAEYHKRYNSWLGKYANEFIDFAELDPSKKVSYTIGWHDKEYLRICMANLYEKHKYGIGKSRITDEEWQRLVDGYKTITGEYWTI